VEIHRSHPESRFTIIPDATLRDRRLSYQARGVLAEILSRPEDWMETADNMWRRARSERGDAGEGRDVLRNVFDELADAGYLYRQRRRVGRGRFATTLHVFDVADGLAAWLAAERFRAQAVDNPPPASVSAGRTDDDTCRRRSDQGERASLQVAPTTGPPGVGPPGVGPPGVSTETDYGDLTTETYQRVVGGADDRQRSDGDHTGILTEPAEVEGARARPDENGERNRQLNALAEWILEHPQAAR